MGLREFYGSWSAAVLILILSGCFPFRAGLSETPTVLEESWVSEWSEEDNIDSPAVWHGSAGQHWIIATAKSTHQLVVYDAGDGRLLRRVGGAGTGSGRLMRPNGVAVVENMLLVVERDNHRVQAFALPDFSPAGEFGADVLRRPYGIALAADTADSSYKVYVTDNYLTDSGALPPKSKLGARVRSFTLFLDGQRVHASVGEAFGDTLGDGCLRRVESIAVDPLRQWLVIAAEQERVLKIYGTDGRFRKRAGAGIIMHEPEGIALHRCPDGGGYWVVADQASTDSRFLVFRREDFTYVGAFAGQVTAETDGVALTQRSFDRFSGGAFYATHRDKGVGAFDWDRVLAGLGLDPACGG